MCEFIINIGPRLVDYNAVLALEMLEVGSDWVRRHRKDGMQVFTILDESNDEF